MQLGGGRDVLAAAAAGCAPPQSASLLVALAARKLNLSFVAVKGAICASLVLNSVLAARHKRNTQRETWKHIGFHYVGDFRAGRYKFQWAWPSSNVILKSRMGSYGKRLLTSIALRSGGFQDLYLCMDEGRKGTKMGAFRHFFLKAFVVFFNITLKRSFSGIHENVWRKARFSRNFFGIYKESRHKITKRY